MTTTRKGFLKAAVVGCLHPRTSLGLKETLPAFKHGEVLTQDKLNRLVRSINDR